MNHVSNWPSSDKWSHSTENQSCSLVLREDIMGALAINRLNKSIPKYRCIHIYTYTHIPIIYIYIYVNIYIYIYIYICMYLTRAVSRHLKNIIWGMTSFKKRNHYVETNLIVIVHFSKKVAVFIVYISIMLTLII